MAGEARAQLEFTEGDGEDRGMAYTRKVKIRPTLINVPAGIVTEGQRKPTFRLTGRSWAIYNVPSYLRPAVNIDNAIVGIRLQVVGKRIYEYEVSR
jgi:hypothetical protein